MTGKPPEWKGSDGKARSEVVNYLTAKGGEIRSDAGLAVVDMQDHLGRSRSLSNLLRTMEHDGMISREVRGRRTYRITLVDDWGLASTSGLEGIVVPIRPELDGQGVPDENVDYSLLAESLLAIVMRKVAEPAKAQPDKITTTRLKQAEVAVAKMEAELHEMAAERLAAQTRVAELEEQTRIYEHNLTVLRGELDKPKSRRGGGTPLSERLSDDERGMLAELMRALPESPQSRPRRTR